MSKENKLIQELLGFYFVWFPIEFLVIYFSMIKNNNNINNYDIKNLFIGELLFFPLKIIFNYLSSNDEQYILNKNTWIGSIKNLAIAYFVLNTYNFNSNKDLLIYLIVIGLMEIVRYYLFELFKKIIKKYTLNTVYKILNGITELSRLFVFIYPKLNNH